VQKPRDKLIVRLRRTINLLCGFCLDLTLSSSDDFFLFSRDNTGKSAVLFVFPYFPARLFWHSRPARPYGKVRENGLSRWFSRPAHTFGVDFSGNAPMRHVFAVSLRL
jgi:hypothetical protein